MNNPFRYHPHPLVQRAAQAVIAHIDSDAELSHLFAPGKMLGVLIVSTGSAAQELDHQLHPLGEAQEGIAFLAAFSGNVGDHNLIPGFVPPIYDLLDPQGGFKLGEAQISAINRKVASLIRANEYRTACRELQELKAEMEAEIERSRDAMAHSKARREALREALAAGEKESTEDGNEFLDRLTRESQFEKAEFRRMKKEFSARIAEKTAAVNAYEEEIQRLKKQRAEQSDALQRWIFEQFQVSDACGEIKSIWDIFQDQGLVPPGGTGECAAPKLLQYAYQHHLQPLYMGEFWYGASPEGSVRHHGHFYPSCSSKCGILLPYMMNGLDWKADQIGTEHQDGHKGELPFRIIYEDETLLAIDKPGGMPAVPGLDGRRSAFEYLQERYPSIEVVHRLDMDTMGLLLFAKTAETAVALRRQFEAREVRKTYRALLVAMPGPLPPEKGTIDLPLGPDYEDRPRQKVDRKQGKPARTEYEIERANDDGTLSVIFHPLDGRTHQLRVHAAHPDGLGRPIAGDPLYGGTACREGQKNLPLQLRATEITFTHPITGERLTLSLWN